MRYQGGKFYQAKHIVPIIHQCMEDNNLDRYYEPFLGGANVMYRVKAKERYGNDIDNELIAYYKHVTNGGESYESVSRELFYDMRDNPDKYEDYQLGNVKYMSSFSSGGFNLGYATPGRRSQYKGALSSFKKQIPKLLDVNFTSVDYQLLEILDNSFVYCDPPYKGTTKYPGGDINHDEFYKWFEELSKRCYCIVSEYNMPENYNLITEMPVRVRFDGKNERYTVDKLFCCDGIFKDYYFNGGN